MSIKLFESFYDFIAKILKYCLVLSPTFLGFWIYFEVDPQTVYGKIGLFLVLFTYLGAAQMMFLAIPFVNNIWDFLKNIFSRKNKE